ncbi:MAG: gliding motility-associated C-terminal domain-containing protein, partial [Saprospiraceae bacterium]|nr:gliding motility-associated C-terminal domain-containing protein [Saprospiraceae bacterium]
LRDVYKRQLRDVYKRQANDILEGVGAYAIELVSNPKLGDLSGFDNGMGVYAAKPGLVGVDTFTYRICSVLCPDNCSEAQVEITIEADDNPEVSRDSMPNGITPNGDGLNDAFVFDALLASPNAFPDNEMIIFNRWGDIVFEAKPYLNNWQGTNTAGEDLPTGTYYYILRLDLANGKIIRGDVTIVR